MAVEFAITAQQPWAQIIAEALALGALGVVPKLTENRGRMVAAKHIGEDVAIHAGKTWDEAGARDPLVRDAWAELRVAMDPLEPNPRLAAVGDDRVGLVSNLAPDPIWCPTGAVVAVATLTGCHPAEPGCCPPWGWPVHYNGQPARHLTLGNVRRLDRPVAASGKQVVPWRLPPDVAAAVDQALAESAAHRAAVLASVRG